MYKLKFTARLEVNPTFGSGEIRFLNPGGHIVPPARPNRVKSSLTVCYGSVLKCKVGEA